MNMNNDIGYDINEADIDKMIHILTVNGVENVTPEKAIGFLEYLKVNLRENAQLDYGRQLLELFDQFNDRSRF